MRVIEHLAALYPWDATASDDLGRAVAFLGWPVAPAVVVRAGYGLGLACSCLGGLVLVLTPAAIRPVVGLALLALVVLAVHAVHALPGFLATARRTNALGNAPELLVLAILRMRLSPSPERAAAFAAETGSGRLADSLAVHVRRAAGTGRTGLDRFGEEWDRWFPSLGRAVGLVTAAGGVPASDRDRALDRAMTVVLEGTRRQMQAFAGGIRGPATGLYAFGVLLPTALVALLPAAGAAGLAISPLPVALVYDVVLPVVLVAASAWVLARRPVTFPPPAVRCDHPDVADRRCLAPLAGLCAAGAAAAGTSLLLPWWGPPFVALGVGVGVGLVLYCRPYVGVYEDVRSVEDGLTDALSLIGRRVATGRSVERAIAVAADELDGRTAEVLAAGSRRQRQLDVGVDAAFLGDDGVLAAVPSPRVRGSVALLAIAAREGEPAGGAILSVAGHLDDLREVERDARESVRTVTETLRSTGALFGPLVGGATVAMAGHMTAGGAALAGTSLAGATASLSWLGLVIGGYVLVLAVVLPALATGLARGLDRHLVGYRAGVALLVATGAYVVGYLGAAAIA